LLTSEKREDRRGVEAAVAENAAANRELDPGLDAAMASIPGHTQWWR
jgi:hypothetical protein